MKRPKYRRHTTRDRAFVEFHGKRTYLPGAWKSPESLAAYRAFLQRCDLTRLEPAEGKPRLIAGLADAFIAWAIATYPPGPRSEAANCRAAIRHLLKRDKATLIVDYGPTRLKALQLDLAHAKKSRTYINAVCERVKRAFKWAVGEELIPPAIYYALAVVPGLRKGRSVALESKPRQPVKWEHVEAVLPELSQTVADMVQVQLLTGVRPQSICGARASQFDRSKTPWIWKPRHKTQNVNPDLIVFVGPQARAVLEPLFDGRDFLFQPLHQNGKRAAGFRSFYEPVSYLRAIRRAIDRVNRERAKFNEGMTESQRVPLVPHWTPHQLRHTRATLVREVHGLEAAQAALGHLRIQTTQIYAQAQTEKAKMVAEAMG